MWETFPILSQGSPEGFKSGFLDLKPTYQGRRLLCLDPPAELASPVSNPLTNYFYYDYLQIAKEGDAGCSSVSNPLPSNL
jgi:hypothetical protein